MSKFYEQTKSNYSRDIDHLVTFNKNGLWIKENLNPNQRIIAAVKPEGLNLIDLTIFHLDEKSNLIEKLKQRVLILRTIIGFLDDVVIFTLIKVF